MKSPVAQLALAIDSKQPVAPVRVIVAQTFWSRAVGLLSRSGLGDDEALLIRPCASIHTIGMRFAIDVVFLSKDYKVLRVAENVRPMRFSFAPRGTFAVLEMASGNANRTGIALDDTLQFV